MIDLLITYDLEGWAYHRRASALARHASADFRVRIARLETTGMSPEERDRHREEVLGEVPPDVLFVLCYHQAKGMHELIRRRGWPTRLIVSWNQGWPTRLNDLPKAFAPADMVVFNNRDYRERAGCPAPSVAIANGVDLDTFRVVTPIGSRPRRVLWCGSQYHRSLKGYDDLVVPLFDRLRREGCDCEALLVDSRGTDKRDAAGMACWYDSAAVFVVTSVSEGTPNTALEAAACGCTIVTPQVGNMPELIRDGENGLLVKRDLESLHRGVIRALDDAPRLAAALTRDIRGWGWAERSVEFFDLFRRVAEAPPRDGAVVARASSAPQALVARPADVVAASALSPSPADLSAEVTVFVSTVGAACFPECMAHLARQDCRFRLEVIVNVAPMSAAFQAMLDRCQTPYYVQVDEDMLLRPHAIRTLHERIKATPPKVPLVVAWLWDADLGMRRQGVKAFRHAVVSRYPYADVQSCEKDQVRRMAADGHIHLRPPETNPAMDDPGVLGVECVQDDPVRAFERYATLEQRRLRYPDKLAWFEPFAGEFLRRFRADAGEKHFFSLLGVIAGRLAGAELELGEKDFRRYPDLPGLREAMAFHAACTARNPSGQAGGSAPPHGADA
jgi:glycosyltransferase involved in cell wall biosynthesis